MEFLESTNFFVRITVYDYCHKGELTKLKFRLIPMVHIGNQEFYDSAKEKILECQELIYEGIQRKRGIKLINSRKILSKKLNLVMQKDALILNKKKLKLTHGDYTEKEAEEGWKKIGLTERLKEKFVNPIKRYFQYKNLTKKKLAKSFMKSYEENYLAYGPRFDEPGTAENYYCAEREKKVKDIISDRINSESKEDKIIGILYGAGHMDRISRYLIDQHNYQVLKGEFMKVFDVP